MLARTVRTGLVFETAQNIELLAANRASDASR
jgi:hypothetical protein